MVIKANDRKLKRIAVPISNRKICSRLRQASSFIILNIKDSLIISIDLAETPSNDPELWPIWLANMGITDVVIKKLCHSIRDVLNYNNINVIKCLPGHKPIDVIFNHLGDERRKSLEKCYSNDILVNFQ
jgi:predicted Fe-Mo cluster-binding NifX family protein